MCIAIVKPKGTQITDEQLRNCFRNNPDGAGIAYSKDGKLYIEKGIWNEELFIETVRRCEQEAQGTMLIHCRIGTSGNRDDINCHPHKVNSETVMIHNGILRIDVPKDSEVSDTVLYIKKYLNPLKKTFMKDKAIMGLLEQAIGSNNKFCFLNKKGEFAIVNEAAGTWDNGIWYSNRTYSYDKTKFIIKNDFGNFKYLHYQKALSLFKPVFNKKARKNIKRKILALSDSEIKELGHYPMYNAKTMTLVSDYSRGSLNCYYLEDISEKLQEIYETQRQLRGLDNEFAA